jgi:WD40 repeat protein
MKQRIDFCLLLLGVLLLNVNFLQAQTLQVTLSPDKSKVDRSTDNGIATIFFDSSIDDLNIVCTEESPDEPMVRVTDNLWYIHINPQKDIDSDGVCYRNFLLKSSMSAEYYLTTDPIGPNQVLYYTVALPNELEPKYLESQAISAAKSAKKLVEEGDCYLAQRLAVSVLPKDLEHPDRPYTNEAETVLRKACGQNNALLKGHTDRVESAAFSPDGKRIVSTSSFDNTIRIWDAETGTELNKLGYSSVCSAIFSPDGRSVASIASWDKTIRLWDTESGTMLQTLEHTGWVRSMAFSPDGKYLVSSAGNLDENVIAIWDVKMGEGKILKTFSGYKKDINSVSYSPDGKCIVSASEDGTIRIWDAISGKELKVIEAYERGVRSATFSPDGKTILSICPDINIWDVETGEKLETFEESAGAWTVEFSPNGKYVVSTSLYSGQISLWDIDGYKRGTYTGAAWDGCFASFSPDGKRIVYKNEITKRIQIRNVLFGIIDEDKNELLSLQNSSEHGSNSVAYSPDGKYIMMTSDNIIRILDAMTGKELKRMVGDTDFFCDADFSPDGSRIVSGSYDGTILIWNAETGRILGTIKGHTKGIESVAFSPDGKRIASASYDNTVRIWDTKSGNELIREEESEPHSVAFTPDGKYVMSALGLYGDYFRIWDAVTGKEVRVITGVTTWVSQDGKYVVSTNEDGICAWNMETSEELRIRPLELELDDAYYGALEAFSFDGKLAVSSAGEDGDLVVWNVETGEVVQDLIGHTSLIVSVAFNPEGTRIVSSSWDETVKIWDVPSLQQLIDQTRERFKVFDPGDGILLTPEERALYLKE